jgi:hypothetical protein
VPGLLKVSVSWYRLAGGAIARVGGIQLVAVAIGQSAAGAAAGSQAVQRPQPGAQPGHLANLRQRLPAHRIGQPPVAYMPDICEMCQDDLPYLPGSDDAEPRGARPSR